MLIVSYLVAGPFITIFLCKQSPTNILTLNVSDWLYATFVDPSIGAVMSLFSLKDLLLVRALSTLY